MRAVRNSIDATKLGLVVNAGLQSVDSFREVQPFSTKPVNFLRPTPTDAGKAAILANNRDLSGVDICFARRKIVEVKTGPNRTT